MIAQNLIRIDKTVETRRLQDFAAVFDFAQCYIFILGKALEPHLFHKLYIIKTKFFYAMFIYLNLISVKFEYIYNYFYNFENK